MLMDQNLYVNGAIVDFVVKECVLFNDCLVTLERIDAKDKTRRFN